MLSVIDEHNNKRQGELNLEVQWPTKDSWFRLFTTFVGTSVTNQRNFLEYSKVATLTVQEAANIISNGLAVTRHHSAGAAILSNLDDSDSEDLVRIAVGPPESPETHKRISLAQQWKQGRSVGSAIQRSCYVCHRYYKQPVSTSWRCKRCGTCLCKEDRRNMDPKRTLSCREEHTMSTLAAIRCDSYQVKMKLPSDLRLWPAWKDPRQRCHHGPP